MRYQYFPLFGPWGLTPVAKFTKRGDDLADCEIYRPAKFHCPTSTYARDIRYHVTKVLRTKNQVRQFSGLAYIPTCRSPITAKHKKFTTPAVTDHAAECFSQHTRSATVEQVCRTGLTSVERVIDFSIFDLGGLPLGQGSPIGEKI